MRIGEDARRCVVFFGKPSPPDGAIKYGGTSFLLAYEEDGLQHAYLVTCRHVAVHLDQFVIRANAKGGAAVPIPVDSAEWIYHPDRTVDLAVTSLALFNTHWDVTYLLAKDLIPDASDHHGPHHCGDDISISGLFRLHSGRQRNVPIIHSGNIAALSDANERIPLRDRTTGEVIGVEAYLVEAQTLDGLSGSPVFIRRPVAVNAAGSGLAMAFAAVHLLGVYQGAWDGEPGSILAEDRSLNNDKIRVPVGMGMVVPASKIMDVIQGKRLSDARKIAIEEFKKLGAASTDSAMSVAPASDENPNAREDFNSLLNAAARKRPQGD